MTNAQERLTAYLDEMDRVNAANKTLKYADDSHSINGLNLNRSDVRAVLAELAAANAVIAEIRSVASHEQITTTWDQHLVKAGDN